MRMSLMIAAALTLILGAGALKQGAQAMTTDSESALQPARFADIAADTGGIRTWIRITELGGLEDVGRRPQTLFVPSDAAFGMLPNEELCELLSPAQGERRRAFLARAGTDSRISPESLSGGRISVTTLDGRALTIDATGGELMVGDAEALDVRTMLDGTVIFVLDDVMLN
ncbi:MAG: fasciclin domain-containing protein [Dongiaceae bacterium]